MQTQPGTEERNANDPVTLVERQEPREIDTQKCMTYDVICTGTADRMGDIIVPVGCNTSEHKEYPVVLFNHGRSYELPVGLAIDRAGNYGVNVENDAVYAWTKYTQKTPFAVQLFALQAEGVLRGNSISARPMKSRELPRRVNADKSMTRCFEHQEWMLHEYSKTPGPVNSEALTILVEKGVVGSEQIHPLLKQYLLPMCLTRSHSQSNGVAIQKSDNTAMSVALDSHGGTLSEPDPNAPLKTEKSMKCDKCGGEHATADCTEKKEVEKAMKPTVRAMASLMQGARDFRAVILKASSDLEDEMGLATINEADGYLEQIEKACHETLVAKGIVDAPEPATGEILKSQVASDKIEQIVFKGYATPPRLFGSRTDESTLNTQIVVDPVELAKATRRLAAMERRLQNVAS